MAQRDDGPREVEFLAVTDASWQALEDDGAARGPEPLGPPGTPGARRALAAAVVLVVGGALVLRTATSHDVPRHPVAAPATSGAAADPGATSVVLQPSAVGTVDIESEPILGMDHCPPPGASGCTVSDGLPLTFLDAVFARLGPVVPTKQMDVGAGADAYPTPWYRQLTATGDGSVRIVVTVSKVGATVSTSSVTQSHSSVTARVTHPSGTGYLIEIDVTGPLGWRPPVAAMTALAADPRLFAPDSP